MKAALTDEARARLEAWHRLSENPDFTGFFLKYFLPTRADEKAKVTGESTPLADVPAARGAIAELRVLVTDINARLHEAKTYKTNPS